MDVVCPGCNLFYPDTLDEYNGKEMECPACNTKFLCQAAKKCSACGTPAAAQAEKCSACGHGFQITIQPAAPLPPPPPQPVVAPQIKVQAAVPQPAVAPQIKVQAAVPQPAVAPQIKVQAAVPQPAVAPQIKMVPRNSPAPVPAPMQQMPYSQPSSQFMPADAELEEASSYINESYFDDVSIYTPLSRIIFFWGRSRRGEYFRFFLWPFLFDIIILAGILLSSSNFMMGTFAVVGMGNLISVCIRHSDNTRKKINALITPTIILAIAVFPPVMLIFVPLSLLLLLAYLPLSIRRLNDIGLGWWCFPVMYIPVLWLGFALCPSQPGVNKHGLNPAGKDQDKSKPYNLWMNLLICNAVSLVLHIITWAIITVAYLVYY